jgi:hypothetical protein
MPASDSYEAADEKLPLPDMPADDSYEAARQISSVNFVDSPTPILTYTTGSSTSSCASTGPSPTFPTPSSSFVTNNPSPVDYCKSEPIILILPAIASLFDFLDCEAFEAVTGMSKLSGKNLLSRFEENVFGMRVCESDGMQV